MQTCSHPGCLRRAHDAWALCRAHISPDGWPRPAQVAEARARLAAGESLVEAAGAVGCMSSQLDRWLFATLGANAKPSWTPDF